jgi:hypothetical protein
MERTYRLSQTHPERVQIGQAGTSRPKGGTLAGPAAKRLIGRRMMGWVSRQHTHPWVGVVSTCEAGSLTTASDEGSGKPGPSPILRAGMARGEPNFVT